MGLAKSTVVARRVGFVAADNMSLRQPSKLNLRRFLFLEAELDLVARLGRHRNGDFAVSM